MKLVTLSTPDGERITFMFCGRKSHMLRKECRGYLCTIEATELKNLDLNEIPIAKEFPQVFQEVPRLPPNREIQFTIELVPGTAQYPRHLIEWHLELTELKT